MATSTVVWIILITAYTASILGKISVAEQVYGKRIITAVGFVLITAFPFLCGWVIGRGW